MTNIQFSGTALTVATMHQLQDRHRQQNSNYTCPIHYYGGKLNQNVSDFFSSYPKPNIPTKTPVRFAGDDDYDGEHSGPADIGGADLAEWGEDFAATWLLSKAADKFLQASPEKYRKVAKYGAPPQEFQAGKDYLRRTKTADTDYYARQAEDKFVTAANGTRVHTHKAHAYRLAAIAAKLRGDTGAARSYMVDAATEKDKAHRRDSAVWNGPVNDFDSLLSECRDFSTKVTSFFKITIFSPLLLAEKLFTDDVKNTQKVIAPYDAAIRAAGESLGKAFETLNNDGYESDREWINGNDHKARDTSTGKGLRHKFLA